MEKESMKELVSTFNKSDLRKKLIPQELGSGWPSIAMRNKELCVTIPYFSSRRLESSYALYPIYCSVTLVVKTGRMVDFTIYPYKKEWRDIDYGKPVGFFRHEAIKHLSADEYKAKRDALYGLYDDMLWAIIQQKPFGQEDAMTELFTLMMEPGLYPLYLRINKKFFEHLYQPQS